VQFTYILSILFIRTYDKQLKISKVYAKTI